MRPRKVEPISLAELYRRLADPTVPKEDLLPYIVAGDRKGPLHSAHPPRKAGEAPPRAPVLWPNPETVLQDDPPHAAAQACGDIDLGALNGAFRARRRARFEATLLERPDAKVLLAEGDSWLQYLLLSRISSTT